MSATRTSRAWSIVPLLILMYLGWGSAFLAIDVVNRDIPPLTGAAIRFLGAAMIMGVPLAVTRGNQGLLPRKCDLPRLVVESCLIVTLAAGGVVLAQGRGAPSWLVALLVATVPVWTVMLQVLTRRTVPFGTLAGTVIGLAGTGLLVWNVGLGVSGLPPIAFGLMAAVGWSIGAFLTSGRIGSESPLVTITQQMFIGGLGLALLGTVLEHSEWTSIRWSWASGVALIWLMVPSSVVALYCFFRIGALSSESVASTYAFVNPIVATILSAIFLAQWPDSRSALAVPLVVIGVALVILSDSTNLHRQRR
jgi:drug/metabolite transporter (DMT)-like permease